MSKRKQEEEKDPEARFSKKARVDQDEEELEEYPLFADVSDGMGSFGKLPTELLEKLCNDLNSRDILNLSETCKALNKQISLNKYIMKHITLRFPTKLERISDVDFGKRIYLNLAYLLHDIEHFKYIRPGIRKIAPNLQSITFPERTYFTRAVQVLSCLPNIRSVIDFPQRVNVSGVSSRSLNLPNLKELTMKKVGRELKIFKDCDQLEHFALTQIELPYMLQEFLNKQNSLQSLEFTWPIDFRFYASEEDLAFQFNLKKLRIDYRHNANVFPVIEANIERFLNKHRESVESFSSDSDVLLPLLRDFPVLNEISLKFSSHDRRNVLRIFPLMPLVEKLDVELILQPPRRSRYGFMNTHVFPIFPSFDSFPNLKEFRGKKLHSNSILAHNGIEVISLDSCTFPDISMPKLKSAKFTNFDGKSLVKWVEAAVENPFAELNKLEMKNMEMSIKCLEIIEMNRSKFQILIMENITERED